VTDEKYRGTGLGECRATARMLGHGHLVHLVTPAVGTWSTTDGMSMERSEEFAAALTPVLRNHP